MQSNSIKSLLVLCFLFSFLPQAQANKCDKSLMRKKPYPMEWQSRQPHGLPQYGLYRLKHVLPTIKRAFAQLQEQWAEVRDNTEAPTFENTIVPLTEDPIGLGQAASYLGVLSSIESTRGVLEVEQGTSFLYSDVIAKLYGDKKLFKRVQVIYENRHELRLTRAERRLVEVVHKYFVDSGVHLKPADLKRMTKLSSQEGVLSSDFAANVSSIRDSFEFIITDKKELEGLPAHVAAQAKVNAVESKKPDSFVFRFTDSTASYISSFAKNPKVRERFHQENLNLYARNEDIVLQLAKIRQEMAEIMGFKDYATYRISSLMAERPENVRQLLDQLFEKSQVKAKEEFSEFVDFVESKTGSRKFNKWDLSYWMRLYDLEKLQIDSQKVKEYFPLKTAFKGVLRHFEKSFEIKFKRIKNISVPHPETEVFEVIDQRTKETIGFFYTDLVKRKMKKGGAHHMTVRKYAISRGKENLPISRIVTNFDPPSGDRPSLISFDNVRTLLHEFGHGMDALFTRTPYGELGRLVFDAIEVPSQSMEGFLFEREFIDMVSGHYRTGKKLPESLLKKLKAAENSMPGWSVVNSVAMSELDLVWHSQKGAQATSVDELERSVFEKYRVANPENAFWFDLPKSQISHSFEHIFAGGYSAGFYGYTWADVLAVQLYNYISEPKIYSAEYRKRFRRYREILLAPSASKPILESFIELVGEGPNVDAYLKEQGLK